MVVRARGIFVVTCFILFVSNVFAQPVSYLYIQGDKTTPFYVKLHGRMLPRYGKNYCIISELSPGPVEIEILFQQNAYPSEKFTLIVPENGSRGFLLSKKEGEFDLYDLQQKKYLKPGKEEKNDH